MVSPGGRGVCLLDWDCSVWMEGEEVYVAGEGGRCNGGCKDVVESASPPLRIKFPCRVLGGGGFFFFSSFSPVPDPAGRCCGCVSPP